jgi:DnaK suppressor protein
MSRSSAATTNPLFERLPEYRAVLEEQWRQQVAQIIELSYAALSPTSDESNDSDESENDPARVTRLQATTRLIAAARQHLHETEAALDRVDDGSYGLCGNCRAPITPERLEAVPATRYCVACQGRDRRR